MEKDTSREFKHYFMLERVIDALTPILIIGFCAIFIGLLWSFAPTHKGLSDWPMKTTAVAMGFAFFFSYMTFRGNKVSIAPSETWLKIVKKGTIIYDNKSKKIESIPSQDIAFLKEHEVFSDRYCFLSIEEKQSIDLTIHPITPNPKVRNIGCQISLKLTSVDQQNLQTVFDLLHQNAMFKIGRFGTYRYEKDEVVWETPIMSMLYDFCNAHSRELSELFNPLKKEQQEEFEKLVHNFFDSRLLQTGIVIEKCHFFVN